MPVRLAAHHPASDPFIPASLPEASWHSRLPEPQDHKPVKKHFKPCPVGDFHVDIAEVHTAEGKLYLFVAIDRTSKFAFAELHGRANKMKEATAKRFHCDDHAQLQQHLASYIDACNFARRLKSLKGLAPYEFICKQWDSRPELFKINSIHLMTGLYT